MLELNLPAVDEETSEAGVWLEFQDGIEFLIARNNNPLYKRALRAMHKKHKRSIEKGTISDEHADALLVDCIANQILLGWRGLTNGKEEFKYTVDNAKSLLLDIKYFELREWIMQQAAELDNFRVKEQKK